MNSNTNNRRTCRHAYSDDMPSHCLWHSESNDHDRCAPCQAYDAEQARRLRDAREVSRQREARRIMCRNGQTDDLNACRGTVAEGNNYGLCGDCETRRRQVALDEIFARHNMSVTAGVAGEEPETILGGGSASGGMPQRVVIEQCERCSRDIYDNEQDTYH